MAKLIYSAITSLDGYIADEAGNFDWAVPDEEVHTFINDLERAVGTYLYGRRMYEVMIGWETDQTLADQSPVMRDFADLWQAADKVVYSKTLETASTARTRIERDFAPSAVRQMKASAGRDLTVGGPELAAPGVPGRISRRVSPVPHAHRGGRRQAVPPQQCPPGARAPGRTPFRQWHGVPPLPHQDVTRRRRRRKSRGQPTTVS
jgi:dihydrofolate reductase